MTSPQVVETSVTNNSSFRNYLHPDDHTIQKQFRNPLLRLKMQNEIIALTKHTIWTSHKNNRANNSSVSQNLSAACDGPGHRNSAASDDSDHRNSATCDNPSH